METTRIYFSMSEVRQMVDLPASTLRYWESQFTQLAPRKDKHGNRYYTQENIDLIKRIKFIRDELKITRIEAIRKELLSDAKQSDAKQRAVDILRRLRQELFDIRAALPRA